MIKFEYIKSSDEELKGSPIFYLNQIYIGNNSAHIHIEEDVSSQFISIELSEIEIKAFLFDNGFFLLNGKRCESHRQIHVGDIITIGGTSLKLISAEYQIYKTKESIIEEKLLEAQNNPDKLKILKLLDDYYSN